LRCNLQVVLAGHFERKFQTEGAHQPLLVPEN